KWQRRIGSRSIDQFPIRMHWLPTPSSRVRQSPPPADVFWRAATRQRPTRRGCPARGRDRIRQRRQGRSRARERGLSDGAESVRQSGRSRPAHRRGPWLGDGAGRLSRRRQRTGGGPGGGAMALTAPSICNFGLKAPDFELKGVDGKIYTFANVRGPKGTLIAFICNHCPYVRAVIGRFVTEANALKGIGIGTIAIMPNDTESYPQDSFENMKRFAQEHGFAFPYVIDETQEVARAYGAQCTPD